MAHNGSNKRRRHVWEQTRAAGWVQFYYLDEEDEEILNRFPTLPHDPKTFYVLVMRGDTELESLYVKETNIGDELREIINRHNSDKFKIQYKHAIAELGWVDLKQDTDFDTDTSEVLQFKLLCQE